MLVPREGCGRSKDRRSTADRLRFQPGPKFGWLASDNRLGVVVESCTMHTLNVELYI